MTTAALATPTARLILPADASEEEWHQTRAQGLGGSDIAAILGMDRYRTPRHVWLEKRGELPDLPRSPQLDEAAEFGHLLEDFIATAWSRRSGHTVLAGPGTLAHVDQEWMRANVDRLVAETSGARAVLECKNRSAYQASDWSGDTPPDQPALQGHWYLAVTGYLTAYIAALIGGNQLRWFRIDRDEELIDHLVALAAEFWASVQDPDAPPPPLDGSDAAAELLAHLWETTAGSMTVVDEAVVRPLINRRQELKDQITAADAELALVENQLKDVLGPNEVGTDDRLRPLVTWKQNGQFATKRFREAEPELATEYTRLAPVVDVDRLAAERPDIYRQYRARVLRVPKGALK